MQQYSTFIFDSYDFDPATRRVELRYSLDGDMSFTETLLFPKEIDSKRLDDNTLNRVLFTLHLMGGASYYKTCCPKTIDVRSGELTTEQAAFWNDVYENGLGEFFYKNNIDFRGLIHFPTLAKNPVPASQVPSPKSQVRPHPLVPIGGGKDSIVTAEILKRAGIPATLFRMGHHPIIAKAAQTAALPLLVVERHLSPALFDLNAQGALNGHVPITGYLSCVSVLTALLTGHTDVILSNERSASEGNVEFHGKEINHQWSKSLAFERAFQEYLRTFVTQDVSYFSLLRPLSELHITQLLSRAPQYLDAITSCNANWKILKKERENGGATWPRSGSTWCGTCPKCAFAFALFAAFLSHAELEHIFGKNLFNDASLAPLYRELLGLSGHKPFECVGTPEETRAAFLLAGTRGKFDDTAMMRMFRAECADAGDDLIADALRVSDDHAIPAPYCKALHDAL